MDTLRTERRPADEYGAIFEPSTKGRFFPTPLARGPWDPNALHGGAVAGLFAHALEQHEFDAEQFVARLTIELLRPVPLRPLVMKLSTVRPGRKVTWIDAELRTDEGDLVACARALRVQRFATERFDVGDAAIAPVEPIPGPDSVPEAPIGISDQIGFWNAQEFRLVKGDWIQPGPGAAWFRLLIPIAAGHTLTQLERVAAAADFGGGVGNPVRGSKAGTINAELTIHLHRPAAGHWVGLDSRAWAHPQGGAMCESVLHDVDGGVGRCSQAMVVVADVPWDR